MKLKGDSPRLREHVDDSRCLYAGVDPSASSLHVGNLLPLMGLLHFKMAGHKAIAIVCYFSSKEENQ